MSTSHQTCKRCEQVFPLTEENFAPHKQYANGFLSRCRPCMTDVRREERRRRLDRMSDAEHDAYKERRRAERKDYRERNKEKIAAYNAAYKLRQKLPGMIRDLRRVRDALDAADPNVKNPWGPSKEWSEWARHMRSAIHERHNRNFHAAANDPVDQYIAEVESTFMDINLGLGNGGLRAAYSRLVADFESLDTKTLHDALAYVPIEKKEYFDAATRSWLEAELVRLQDKPMAAGPSLIDRLMDSFEEFDFQAANKESKENLKRRSKGLPEVITVGGAPEEFGGLAREVAARERRVAQENEARLKRNRRRRERRAALKKRKAQKAESARKRRAEGRKT